MGKKNRVRIDTSGTSEAFGNNAFSGLSLEGLPDGPPQNPDDGASNKALTGDSASKSKIRLEVRREKSGRAGKTVTTVRGIETMEERETSKLLKGLKKRLATGGTISTEAIEIQGDFADAVTAHLLELGYRALRAGG